MGSRCPLRKSGCICVCVGVSIHVRFRSSVHRRDEKRKRRVATGTPRARSLVSNNFTPHTPVKKNQSSLENWWSLLEQSA